MIAPLPHPSETIRFEMGIGLAGSCIWSRHYLLYRNRRRAGSARAVSATFLLVFFQQRIEQGFRPVESSAFQVFNRLAEVNQAAFRGEIEDAERACYEKTFSAALTPLRSSISSRSAWRATASWMAAFSPASISFSDASSG